MSDLTVDSLKKEILVVVNQRSAVLPGTGSRPPEKAHKMNVIGRQYSPGELERNLGRNFTAQERALASRAWDELKSNGYIEPTFDDIAEPEAWVLITDAGRAYLGRDLKDQIDVALERISPHLLELRRGMADSLLRSSPDTVRQAAHSGLEAQFRDLQALGCEKVIKEQTSSVGPRRGLEEAMEFARSGDTLLVTKLDRLARRVPHMWEIIGRRGG